MLGGGGRGGGGADGRLSIFLSACVCVCMCACARARSCALRTCARAFACASACACACVRARHRRDMPAFAVDGQKKPLLCCLPPPSSSSFLCSCLNPLLFPSFPLNAPYIFLHLFLLVLHPPLPFLSIPSLSNSAPTLLFPTLLHTGLTA